MSMEYKMCVFEMHARTILCVAFNPYRREIYTGAEETDTTIKVWESDSGKLLNTLVGHVGWVTTLLYCKELKFLLSGAIDGHLIVWGPNGKILQNIEVNSPIYALAFNSRRQQFLAGLNGKVRLFQVANNEELQGSNDILEKKSMTSSEHTDIVSCIVSCEGKFYSAGYDRRIVIYDSPYVGEMRFHVLHNIPNAHDAAISCMVYGKDADNSWLITGSFDRVVKLWSLDGNFLQRFDGFSDTISSICYVLPVQAFWVAVQNSSSIVVCDPRSGINVSEFASTDEEQLIKHGTKHVLRSLLFVPELYEVIATTNRRSVILWKYNLSASLTNLNHAEVIEALTFTSKEPLLIFSGGGSGIIHRWERMQLNTFMYSQDIIALPKEDHRGKAMVGKHRVARNIQKRRMDQIERHRNILEKIDNLKSKDEQRYWGMRESEIVYHTTRKLYKRREKRLEQDVTKRKLMQNLGKKEDTIKVTKPSVVSMVYDDRLDLLVCGFEDSKICCWGYNEESVALLPPHIFGAMDMGGVANDEVTNRVAGLSCKYVFHDHKDAVTGLVCFEYNNNSILLSTGWDRRICIWNLDQGGMVDFFRNPTAPPGKEELAADGLILDMDFAKARQEFGYCATDKSAYIRKFHERGDKMTLVAVLQGHESEVTRIKWNSKTLNWVTGSEDRTIRIWHEEGIPCLKVVNNDSPVTALCIDTLNGCIISGSQDKMVRVFDGENVVQKNAGHADEVRDIIHIPTRNQYVSGSWDGTIRIWNAYMKKGQRRLNQKEAKMQRIISQSMLEQEPANEQMFSELNPLVVPKLLAIPTYIKDAPPERHTAVNDDLNQTFDKMRFDDELRTTLNDLENALNETEQRVSNKKSKVRQKSVSTIKRK